jgi:hypothetical protein
MNVLLACTFAVTDAWLAVVFIKYAVVKKKFRPPLPGNCTSVATTKLSESAEIVGADGVEFVA